MHELASRSQNCVVLDPEVPPEAPELVPAGRLPVTQVPPLQIWVAAQSSFSSQAPALVDEHAIATTTMKPTITMLPSQFDFMVRAAFLVRDSGFASGELSGS
jgi:hypothetical protein